MGCVAALSKVNGEETPQSSPRGARMVLKDYSDKEAVRSREQGQVSTLINRKRKNSSQVVRSLRTKNRASLP